MLAKYTSTGLQRAPLKQIQTLRDSVVKYADLWRDHEILQTKKTTRYLLLKDQQSGIKKQNANARKRRHKFVFPLTLVED